MSAPNESSFHDGRRGRVPVEYLHSQARGFIEEPAVEQMAGDDETVIGDVMVAWPSHRCGGQLGSFATAMLAVGLKGESHVIDAVRFGRQGNVQIAECGDGTRGQQTATGLVSANPTFDDGHSTPSARQLNRGRGTRRPTANNEHVGRSGWMPDAHGGLVSAIRWLASRRPGLGRPA